MLQERSIFLRLEPLKALLWDKYTELGPGCSPPLPMHSRPTGSGPADGQ